MVHGFLAIVGSQILTVAQVSTARWLIQCIIRSEQPRLVISGGAEGIDTLAEDTARLSLISVKIFEPQHKSWNGENGKTGYKFRNLQIVELCDELVCIRSRQSQTYGSGWTADAADAMGKTVRRFWV